MRIWLEIKKVISSVCRRNQQKRDNKLNSKIKSLCTRITRLQSKGEPSDSPVENLAQALDQYGGSARLANFERWRKSGNKVNPYTLCKVRLRCEPTVIKALRNSASEGTGTKQIPEITQDFYRKLYDREEVDELDVKNTLDHLKASLKSRGLAKTTMKGLDAPITAPEVLQSIRSLQSGKSPGPDGLGIELDKSLGISVATILAKVYNSLLDGAKAPRAYIEGMVILLFKKGDPTLLKNYRPITLQNVDYKILTKLLALRLSRALEPYISKYQSAFLPGRLISNNIRDIQMTEHHLEQAQGMSGALLSVLLWETGFCNSSSTVLSRAECTHFVDDCFFEPLLLMFNVFT
ncbi:hypothetical protein [Parasitella parasitica]|uniref:Uncharacterized protein n=1 Tax=Parasitella parasitica TaxID=35722 RepID=A0A0B7N1Y0_9FUNG|nr:hypothetical protein [Parasitella parasitica]